MSELISVLGDKNSHNNGSLLASNNSGKVFIGGIKVVYVGSSATPDDLDHPNPSAATGSGKVFAEGNKIHRNNDLRDCGASTIVSGQSKVFAG